MTESPSKIIHLKWEKVFTFLNFTLQSNYIRMAGNMKVTYEELFESMTNGFAFHRIITDKSGKPIDYIFLHANKAFEKLTGLPRKKLLGRKVTEILPGIEKDPADWIGKYGQVAISGKPICFEQYSHVLNKHYTVHAYSPRKEYFAVIFDEITDIKETQKDLKHLADELTEETEVLTAIMENTNAQVAFLDADFNFVRVNSQYAKGSGYAVESLIGRNHFDLFPDKENEKIFKKVRRTGIPAQFKAKPFIFTNQPDRGVTYWDWTLTPIKRGDKVMGLVLSLSDVTNHALLEKQLRESINDLENIKFAVDQSALVTITDNRGTIQYVNDRLSEISQYKPDELIGKNPRVFNSGYHPPEFFRKLWSTVLSGRVWHGEMRNRAKDGSFFWVDTTITPLLDENKKPKQFIVIRSDITQRKRLEEKKDEFISVASHELKTPLTSIKAFAQILRQRVGKLHDKKSSEYVLRINEQLDRLTRLVLELLDTSRIQQGRLNLNVAPVSIHNVIGEAVNEISQISSKHRIHYVNGTDCTVTADRERLHQVLSNLLTNAIKYSPERSEIKIRCSVTDHTVTVSIQDRGAGIPKEERKKIFERFYQVRETRLKHDPSMGLGLYISREIILRHGGKIWVDSTKGKGSTFYFSLPLRREGSGK